MIHDLKPYPAMKDSGVPWLGQVPEHWEIKRLGSVLKERGEVNQTRQVIEVLSVMKDIGVIPYSEKGNIGNKKSDEIERYKVVRPDDLVMNSMNVIIGSVGRSKYTGCLSQVYYVLERRDLQDDAQYIEAFFRNKRVQHSLTRIGNGILAHRMRIPMELLKSEPFLLPPPAEQAAIVRFLDHADRRIRRTIAAKQRLIKLLQEQKQVIIHQAVTRGLDPNVKLKPSGVEWLGNVPEKWQIKPLNALLFEQQQKNTGLKVNKVLSLSYGKIIEKPKEKLRGLVPESFETYQIVSPLNIIIRPTDLQNDQRSLRIGLVKDTGIITSAYMSLTTKGIDPEYSFWLLASFDYIKIFYNLGAGTRQSLKFTDIKRLPILIPLLTEQKNIVRYIEVATAKLDQTISRAQSEIALLREYGTRLIADVVTGKLDVREAVAGLPELDAEPLPDDLEPEDGDLEGEDAEAEADAGEVVEA